MDEKKIPIFLSMEGVVYCLRGNDEDCHLKVAIFLFHFYWGVGGWSLMRLSLLFCLADGDLKKEKMITAARSNIDYL